MSQPDDDPNNVIPIDGQADTEVDEEPELWSARRLARYFSVHPSTVLRWARRGVIPCRRVTTQTLRFSHKEIEAMFLESGFPGG